MAVAAPLKDGKRKEYERSFKALRITKEAVVYLRRHPGELALTVFTEGDYAGEPPSDLSVSAEQFDTQSKGQARAICRVKKVARNLPSISPRLDDR